MEEWRKLLDYQRKYQGMQLLERKRWQEYIKMSLKEVEGNCVG